MTQADRDRLVTLRKAKKRVITKAQAAEELGLSVRQVKRLVAQMKKGGDPAVIHGLRGRPSNHRTEEARKDQVVMILGGEEYGGFGPTLAAESLGEQHGIEVSRETVRKWMKEAGLWKVHARGTERVHMWRARRSRFGELVQWDTSEHDWLEGRGPRLYLIALIDDATSRAVARFVEHDSTESNMEVLEGWLRRYGRMLACYTDKAGLFQTAVKTKREEQRAGKDRDPMPPTQIGRALGELNIVWMRDAVVRVEERRDGTIAIRFRDEYLRCTECQRPEPAGKPHPAEQPVRPRKGPNAGGKSKWMQDFLNKPGPSLNRAIKISNATS